MKLLKKKFFQYFLSNNANLILNPRSYRIFKFTQKVSKIRNLDKKKAGTTWMLN